MRTFGISAILAAVLYTSSLPFWMGEGKWVHDSERPVPDIPVRTGGRGCCVLGRNIRADIAGIPVPFVNVTRIGRPDELGPHRYDAAWGAFDDPRGNAFPLGEANFLIYTCRGGFIDTAHLREPVDWIAFFLSQLDRHLEEGTVVRLPNEGGARRVIIRAVPESLIRRNGRDEIMIATAQWIAHQLGIWHEIVQWYGISMLKAFPETASGFSPEDLYSNAVGLRLMDGVDFRRQLVSEITYDRFIDELLANGLRALDPVPQSVGERAIGELDQLWWDSNVRLPRREVVLRRYLDADDALSPWLFPERHASPELRAQLEEACGPRPEPYTVRIPDALQGFAIRDYVTLEFTLDGTLAGIPVFDSLGPRFDQEAFPTVMKAAAIDVRDKLGPRADRPD